MNRNQIGEIADEKINLMVSKDSMKAYIWFMPPVGGNALDKTQILRFLASRGIVFGLKNMVIEHIAAHREYGDKYLVAEGVYPTNGIDGYLTYFFDTAIKKPMPQIKADGSADYHCMDLFEQVEEGQVLARVTDGIKGSDGTDIYGRVKFCKPGNPAPKLVVGDNVCYSQDNACYTAESSGQVFLKNRRISVSKVLEIRSDVGPATGDLDFAGSIRIYGNVLSDFKVKARGNVEVFGTVEGAEIRATGSVIVTRGIIGFRKTQIIAGENISAKFISDSIIVAGKYVIAESLIRCDTKCFNHVELIGRGVVSGGCVIAGISLKAKTTGSPMAVKTSICAGLDPLVFSRYNNYMNRYKKLEKEYKELIKIIKNLKNLEQTTTVSSDKLNFRMSAEHQAKFMAQNLQSIEAKIAGILPRLKKNTGFVHVGGTVYPGVKIQIGNAVMFVKDELYNNCFENDNGAVKYYKSQQSIGTILHKDVGV